MPNEIHDFQLVREIKTRQGGREVSGLIRIGEIQWSADKEAWACRCAISFLHDDSYITYGVDAIHALKLCMRSLAGLIAGAEEDGLEIWWLEPGDHCGFV